MHITTFHLMMAAYHTIAAYPPHRTKLRAEFERAIEIANAGRSPIHAASLAVELTHRIADGQMELVDDELRSLASEGFMEVGDEWLCDVLHAAWSHKS